MTSPPYWGLRDYGHEDQLGLEETPEKYVENLMEVFNELKRVLKATGTFYLNIDDSYGNPETSDKCMAMIPERVMMAMVENGWILRNKVVWNKPNPMPESVKDRFSTTWEYVYMFSLEQDYYFDLDAVREPHKETSKERAQRGYGDHKWRGGVPGSSEQSGLDESKLAENGKNPGDTWDISTKSFSDAHFAVYPPELCEKPVKAGCPKKVCSECGQPLDKFIKSEQKTITDESL